MFALIGYDFIWIDIEGTQARVCPDVNTPIFYTTRQGKRKYPNDPKTAMIINAFCERLVCANDPSSIQPTKRAWYVNFVRAFRSQHTPCGH